MNRKEQIIEKLVATKKWDAFSVELGIRARFKCEYCGKDMFASVENYKEWTQNYIIPNSKGGIHSEENIALACRTCGYSIKNKWNPADHIKGESSRAALINATREHIAQQRKNLLEEILYFKSVINNIDGM